MLACPPIQNSLLLLLSQTVASRDATCNVFVISYIITAWNLQPEKYIFWLGSSMHLPCHRWNVNYNRKILEEFIILLEVFLLVLKTPPICAEPNGEHSSNRVVSEDVCWTPWKGLESKSSPPTHSFYKHSTKISSVVGCNSWGVWTLRICVSVLLFFKSNFMIQVDIQP